LALNLWVAQKLPQKLGMIPSKNNKVRVKLQNFTNRDFTRTYPMQQMLDQTTWRPIISGDSNSGKTLVGLLKLMMQEQFQKEYMFKWSEVQTQLKRTI
jgi:hypothetical protein